MSPPGPDWRTLNAYVDGELDPEAAGRVAEAAGRDPSVAGQIAALYRLKGIARSAVAPSPPDLMEGVAVPVRPAVGRVAIGALVAALALGAGLWFAPTPRTTPAVPPAVMRAARDLHEKWLVTGSPRATSAAKMLAALSNFGSTPSIPDLRGTGLTIGFVASEKRAGHRVLQVGYRGRHGCRLSLFVFHDIGFARRSAEVVSGNILAYAWEARDLAYLLFAEGMDRNRFELIGREVARATRRGRPLDAREQTRLAQNRRESTSCKA